MPQIDEVHRRGKANSPTLTPHRLPVLRSRFHDYFFDLVLDQPLGQLVTALMQAVTQGDAGLVKLLLDRQADASARDHAGRSVLLASIDAPDHFSERSQVKCSFEIFRLPMENGSRLDMADEEGNTPLLAALQRGHWEAVRLLVARGADVGARNKNGQTVFDLAVGTPVEEVVHARKA